MESSRPRICVSLPVHEQPAVVLDQVENLRAFLPESTQIVLHVSQSLQTPPSELAPMLPPGVHVNPRSHPTRWGDVLFLHNDNLRFAFEALEPFDYVLLHSSNDLYVRPGAERHVAGSPVGAEARMVSADTSWEWNGPAHRDPALRAVLADAGARAEDVVSSRLEGSFYRADLFAEMLARISRRFEPGMGEHYPREEVYYPSLAMALAPGDWALPTVYWDFSLDGTVPPATVWGIVDGTYATDEVNYDFDHLYAVKRVMRDLHDPTRRLIRALARARGSRLRLRPPFEAREFVAMAFGAHVVADDSLVARWLETFDESDAVTLAIHVALEDDVRAVMEAAYGAGAEEPGAADVTLCRFEPGTFAEAVLRWGVGAVYTPEEAPVPDLLDSVPRVTPDTVGAVRGLASRARTHSLTGQASHWASDHPGTTCLTC